MLLKCIPELIKQDLIASRTMTDGHHVPAVDYLPAGWELCEGEHPQAAHGAEGGDQCTRSPWRTPTMETVDEQAIGTPLRAAGPNHLEWMESCIALQMPWEDLVGRSWPIGWLP